MPVRQPQPVPAFNPVIRGPTVIGYSYSNGAICMRCALETYGGEYPRVPYLTGPIGPIMSSTKPFDRYCDNCGDLIDYKK